MLVDTFSGMRKTDSLPQLSLSFLLDSVRFADLLASILAYARSLVRTIAALGLFNALSMHSFAEQSESRTTQSVVHSRAGNEGTNVALISAIEPGIGACTST